MANTSGDQIRLVYASAQNMAKAMQQGVQTLSDTLSAVQGIAGQMEGGALKGEAGQEFVQLINSVFTQSMNKLLEKFNNTIGDIYGGISDMQEADSQSAGLF